jgi:hypothetical protein
MSDNADKLDWLADPEQRAAMMEINPNGLAGASYVAWKPKEESQEDSEEEYKELIERLRLENEMRVKQEEERRISKETEKKEKAELFAQQLEKIKEMGGFEHDGLYLIPNVVIPKRGVNKGKKGITFRAFSVNEDSKTIQEVNHRRGSFLQPGINYFEEDIPEFSHLFKE